MRKSHTALHSLAPTPASFAELRPVSQPSNNLERFLASLRVTHAAWADQASTQEFLCKKAFSRGKWKLDLFIYIVDVYHYLLLLLVCIKCVKILLVESLACVLSRPLDMLPLPLYIHRFFNLTTYCKFKPRHATLRRIYSSIK